jgi:hypothetical protein
MDKPDGFKRKLTRVFPFKRENDRCNLSETCYLPINVQHFTLEKCRTKNRHTRRLNDRHRRLPISRTGHYLVSCRFPQRRSVRSKSDGEQSEAMRPLLRVLRVRNHDLLATAVLPRRKRADELQFVLGRNKLPVPGGSRILFNWRSLLRFWSNTRSGCKLLSQSDTGGHRKTGTNRNEKSSHKLPRFTALYRIICNRRG